MTRIIPVFVNSKRFELPNDATALDAVRMFSESEASGVLAGARVVLDDRGLPIDPSTTVHGGSIFRIVPARAAARADDADHEAE